MNKHKFSSSPQVLLVGNGPYLNRGCEAIVRGTRKILNQEFGAGIDIRAGVIAKPDVIINQNENETDPMLRSFSLKVPVGPRWSSGWCIVKANQRLGTSIYPQLKDLREPTKSASVALEIGGDHYSLDYGKPLDFMAMDRYILKQKIPLVLWGASVGPFDSDPVFSPKMFEHLRNFSGIFVRETESLNYLKANGVSGNVHLMGDPAFVMEPVEPTKEKVGFIIPEGAIGINLSPMLAFYRKQKAANVNMREWACFCTDLIKSVANLKKPILLIPHVISKDPGNDDYTLLDTISKSLREELDVLVQVVPPTLGAAELKWVISKCVIFAGGRTHSTIAALSSLVPTLSIGYSLKARGINRDTYGHLDHCLPVADLSVKSFTRHIVNLLDNEASIRRDLASSIPLITTNAMKAGVTLRKIIDQHQLK